MTQRPFRFIVGQGQTGIVEHYPKGFPVVEELNG